MEQEAMESSAVMETSTDEVSGAGGDTLAVPSRWRPQTPQESSLTETEQSTEES